MEAARALGHVRKRMLTLENRYQRQYLKFFQRATTSYAIMHYQWPTMPPPLPLEQSKPPAHGWTKDASIKKERGMYGDGCMSRRPRKTVTTVERHYPNLPHELYRLDLVGRAHMKSKTRLIFHTGRHHAHGVRAVHERWLHGVCL
jgi:hypothetical protein